MRFFHITTAAFLLFGCATTQAETTRQDNSRCPDGSFNYGDGMVAMRLPKEVKAVLGEAHAYIQALASREGDLPDLAGVSYAPHVSIIYGVTDSKATPAQQALHAFLPQAHTPALSFGNLNYWDDAKGDKTSLVFEILEPQGLLPTLHDTLASAAQIASRFAYHPHVTVAYVPIGWRLAPEVETELVRQLQTFRWRGRSLYMTNPCGGTIAEFELPEVK